MGRGHPESFYYNYEKVVSASEVLLDAAAVLKEVGSSESGLSSEEAVKRLERDGRNELAAEKKDSLIKRFFAQMLDPMIIILLAAAAISAVLAVAEGESFADVVS